MCYINAPLFDVTPCVTSINLINLNSSRLWQKSFEKFNHGRAQLLAWEGAEAEAAFQPNKEFYDKI